MANVKFYTIFCPPDYINKKLYDAQYGNKSTVKCDIVQPCSMLEPVIILGGNKFNYKSANYMYMEDFDRYYYISNIEALNNDMVAVHLKIDPLYTFRAAIKNLNVMVVRQEKASNCTGMVPDPLIAGRIDRQIVKRTVGTVGGMPSGRHIALTVTGGAGTEPEEGGNENNG